MTASAYLRHPALLLVAVSAVIAFVWFWLGRPVEMPRSPFAPGEKLDCVSYAPVPPHAASAVVVSPQRIEADLARLAPLAACVRTYMTGGGLDRLPDIASRHGLSVLQGIAIGRDAARNSDEIERAIALAPTHRDAIRAFVVGSEVLSRRDMDSLELSQLTRRVREATRIPVTYADRWETWLNAEALAGAVDFITIHVGLYRAEFPARASDAVLQMLNAQAKVAKRFSGKRVMIGEVGWPSAGRMREAAMPSPANQARVLHELVAAAKAGDFQLNLLEGYDQPWRERREGGAGGHWGLLDAETGAQKFRWGAPVRNHPLWFMQGSLGVMLAFVVFAAGYAAARSYGLAGPGATNWRPVAVIALVGGLPIGWAVAEVPLQAQSMLDWIYAIVLIAIAFAAPPLAAAAVVRKIPFEGFAIAFNRGLLRAVHPLGQAVAIVFVFTVLLAIQLALALVFDPEHRALAFAPFTGPVIALLVFALCNPGDTRRDTIAEAAAAAILAGAAFFIVVNETYWNWQALWLAVLLLALAWTCWRARAGQTP